MENKVCKIINGKHSWILEVDNHRIPFKYLLGAEYFEKHYKELGYEVLLINECDN